MRQIEKANDGTKHENEQQKQKRRETCKNKSATEERVEEGGVEERERKRGPTKDRRQQCENGVKDNTEKKYEAAKTNQLTEQRERWNETKVHRGEMRNDGGRKGE